jgi:hypothetical protein
MVRQADMRLHEKPRPKLSVSLREAHLHLASKSALCRAHTIQGQLGRGVQRANNRLMKVLPPELCADRRPTHRTMPVLAHRSQAPAKKVEKTVPEDSCQLIPIHRATSKKTAIPCICCSRSKGSAQVSSTCDLLVLSRWERAKGMCVRRVTKGVVVGGRWGGK